MKKLLQEKNLLFLLIKNDFRKHYLGSYFGLIWAFAQPISFIFIIWFVFDVGFRAPAHNTGVPFFLWLLVGIVPWFFIADALTSGSTSIVNNSFLVKKIAFNLDLLPLVAIGSSLIIHSALLLIVLVILILNGYYPSKYWIQLPFYLILNILLILGFSWVTSAVRVFVKDISNFLVVILQFGFWATPIFWSIDMIPLQYQWIIKINPAYFIIGGYRDSLISGKWFWEDMTLLVYYIILTIFFFCIGKNIFRKLKIHFADVL